MIRLLYWTICMGNIACILSLDWIGESKLYETEFGQCYERGVRYSTRKDSIILIVGTEWWPRSGDMSWNFIQKDISTQLVNAGYTVYLTVIDPTDEEIKDARNYGINLIIAQKESQSVPYTERLRKHRHYFPNLHTFRNIAIIIGIVDRKMLADAARNIQNCFFKDASFVPFITYIPEDTDMERGNVADYEERILNYARNAKVIVSVGLRIYLHFENKFRAIGVLEHLQFFPGVDDQILSTNISFPSFEGTIEILTFDFVSRNVLDCIKHSEIAALSIGKIANGLANIKTFKWKIRGLPEDIASKCGEELKQIADSPYLSIQPYPLKTDILKVIGIDFEQCHLHIFAPIQDPTGIITLLSSAAGVPTLCTEHSGFSAFLRQNMQRHYNEIIVGKYGIHENTSKIAEIWKERVINILADTNRYEIFFKNAKELQHELKVSIKKGHIATSRERLFDMLNREVDAKFEKRYDFEVLFGRNLKKEDLQGCKIEKEIKIVPMYFATNDSYSFLSIDLNGQRYIIMPICIIFGVLMLILWYVFHEKRGEPRVKTLRPDTEDSKLLVLRSDKQDTLFLSAEMYLPTIFNVNNCTALRGDHWDFLQFMVKMTKNIHFILSTRQEILSLLGIREFFVTDIDSDTHDFNALADHFDKQGRVPLCIKTSAKPYSLSVRSLIPYKVSHKLVDQKGQRLSELDQTDWHEALKLVLKYREEEITKLMGNLSTVESRVRQLESENTAQNRTVQENRNLELQLKHGKQEVEILQGLLRTEKYELKRAEKALTKSALDSRLIQEKLSIAMQEKSNLEQRLENLEDINKKQKTELVRADEMIKCLYVNIRELESKSKLSEIPRVDKRTCTPSLPEKTLEELSEVISVCLDNDEESDNESDGNNEKTSSSIKPIPIGGTNYICEKKPVEGTEWTVQVLGNKESGTEPGQFNHPKGLAWHGDQLVICDTGNHRIQILNKNKVVIEIIRFDGQFDKECKPYAVAISPDGHLLITDIGNNQIIICDKSKQIINIIPQSAGIEVRSIAVMEAFIFVTDSKGKSLVKYNIKDGKLVARVSDQFSDPHSVIATSDNHLLVSDRDKNVIHVLDSDLNFLNSYHNDNFENSQGLDVDSHGNIYICRFAWLSNGIVKLRSNRQLDCVLFEGVGYYQEFIAVNDDITTTIAVTGLTLSVKSKHQIRVYSVST